MLLSPPPLPSLPRDSCNHFSSKCIWAPPLVAGCCLPDPCDHFSKCKSAPWWSSGGGQLTTCCLSARMIIHQAASTNDSKEESTIHIFQAYCRHSSTLSDCTKNHHHHHHHLEDNPRRNVVVHPRIISTSRCWWRREYSWLDQWPWAMSNLPTPQSSVTKGLDRLLMFLVVYNIWFLFCLMMDCFVMT